MFKRSLASVAAVAIASGAVVAPANAMTMKVNNGICTFDLTDEEAKSVLLHPKAQFTKEEATASKVNVEKKLLEIRAQIEKDQAELAKDEVSDEQRKHLTSELEENKKKVTANEDFRNALTACIDGKAYNSDKSSGTDQSGDSNNPEGQGKPGGTDQSGDSNNPEGQGKPGGTDQSGGTEKPKVPGKPGAQPAPPSNDGAGIGVIFAGAIAAILGILAAALPIIKPMLPPQLRALLP
ncbi:hypothetical protein FRC0276_01820 [Corynebacterium diphtheriae]|nr:hypothetical protein FRC0276_01820 [Corynebacterium diphtheriae]